MPPTPDPLDGDLDPGDLLRGDSPLAAMGDLPRVVVHGAGVAGLTAAHELIERGFEVDVIEPAEDPFRENACLIGGLAANQHSRVPASIEELHGDVWGRYSEAQKRAVTQLRDGALQQTQPRFPLRQTLRFDRRIHGGGAEPVARPPRTPFEPGEATPIPDAWEDYWDEYGVQNAVKLDMLLRRMRQAWDFYARVFDDRVNRNVTAFWNRPAEAATATTLRVREILRVRVVAHTDDEGSPGENRALALQWGEAVRSRLLALNASPDRPEQSTVPHLEEILTVVPLGADRLDVDLSTPLGRRRANRVEFEVVEQIIPGEHGFRFFPSFYRHLFDTMRRTPILDERGASTGRSAYDQLVPTPGALLALNDGKAPVECNPRDVTSARQLQTLAELFTGRLGFTALDLAGLQFFTARYATSCDERRRREAEDCNYVQYVGGRERYSEAAVRFIDRAPRALAAMSATESDARTQLDILLQMTLPEDGRPRAPDMTLDGPTSHAWLDHWKRYLEIQGVRFHLGRLTALKLEGAGADARFAPELTGPGDHEQPIPENPYPRPEASIGNGPKRTVHILATSFQAATDLAWNAYAEAMAAGVPFAGTLRELVNFDRRCGRRAHDGALTEPARDAHTGALLNAPGEDWPEHPLRTISGLQFFFRNSYRIGEGNIYFPDSPWGLTSISQFAYWRDRIRPVGRFLGQISVDLGDWHSFYPARSGALDFGAEFSAHGHPAWRSSSVEIAARTWDQVKDGLQVEFGSRLAPPEYYHVDKNMVFLELDAIGFGGNLILRVHPISAPNEAYRVDLLRTLDPGSPFADAPSTLATVEAVAREGDDADRIADALVREIGGLAAADGSRLAFARRLPTAEGAAPELIVSPSIRAREVTIRLRLDGDRRHFIRVGGMEGEIATRPGPDPHVELPADIVATAAYQNVAFFDDAEGRPVGAYVRLGFDPHHPADVAVLGGDIEIVGGPRLDARFHGANVQPIQRTPQGSGRRTRIRARDSVPIAFRPVERRGEPGPTPGLRYGLSLAAGDRAVEVSHVAETPDPQETPATAWKRVRSALLAQLPSGPDDPLMVETAHHAPMALIAEIGGPRDGAGPAAEPPHDRIVVSGVHELETALISLAPEDAPPTPSGAFRLRVNGVEISVDGDGLGATGLRDAILQRLRAQVGSVLATPVGAAAIRLVPRPDPDADADAVPTLRVGALNAHRGIEVVGAPPLEVAAVNLPVALPKSAFTPLRNESEFLINVPGQWRWRPGLVWRPSSTRVTLHDPRGTLDGIDYAAGGAGALRDWIPAGTYMATYTRMTTMEAANESARHAVAALLRDLTAETGRRRPLPSDMPGIWNLEDREPADLDYWKDLDAQLLAQGLPHVFDALGLTRLTLEALARREEADALGVEARRVGDALRAGLPSLLRAAGLARGAAGGAASRRIDALERMLTPTLRAERPLLDLAESVIAALRRGAP